MISEYAIWSRKDCQAIHPVISFNISRDEFLATDMMWREYKESHRPNPAPAHHDWSWLGKTRHAEHHVFVALKHAGKIEGMMMLDLTPRLCWLQGTNPLENFIPEPGSGRRNYYLQRAILQRAHETMTGTGKCCLYIEYLETAPWNQKPYAGEGARFAGVGTCLLDVAMDQSESAKCGGRLGLHALEDAKKFYVEQGFTNLGPDPLEGFDYFELTDIVLETTS